MTNKHTSAKIVPDKVLNVCHSDCQQGKPCQLSDDGSCYVAALVEQYDMHWIYTKERDNGEYTRTFKDKYEAKYRIE